MSSPILIFDREYPELGWNSRTGSLTEPAVEYARMLARYGQSASNQDSGQVGDPTTPGNTLSRAENPLADAGNDESAAHEIGGIELNHAIVGL